MKVLGIIPARYGSTRFPGKPLAMIGDKTMIHRTYDQVMKSSLDAVVVATDDRRINDEVLGFGGHAVMTSPDHRSGTDRCREALETFGGDFDAVVNIQGDEPFIDPRQIDMVAVLVRTEGVDLATLARKIDDAETLFNPNVVKVVFDHHGDALYFSRHPIPYVRGLDSSLWLQHALFFQHIGLYAYTTPTLKTIASLPMGSLERAESLEQLRWLEHGLRIRVAVSDIEGSIAIDTPEDLNLIPKELLR